MNTQLLSEQKGSSTLEEAMEPKLIMEQGVDMEKLIGTPHTYGRFQNTRDGFVIVPIATMTLQADGRITGYSHPNEGSWKRYEHGTVDADKAFAFISGFNKYIPSSTWQQTFGGMPIGYFCDEPESLQKLCLIPNTKPAKKPKVVYLVASCLRFYEKTMPKLLQDLFDEGIAPEQIKVVVNGADKNDDEVIDGVAYAFSTHNAWEYSALYEAPLRWQFDYAMLIHDTNQIFPGFKRKVENFNTHLHWDHLPATPLARCLLGLYSHHFLSRLNTWLQKIDGIDKVNGIIAEASGEILLRARTALVMGNIEDSGMARQAEWKEVVDVYNTGTPRVRRIFPAINLHKFIHAGATDPKHL